MSHTAIRVLTCENRSAPAGAWNSLRGLTHSSDLSREGLAMKATRAKAIPAPRAPLVIPPEVAHRALSKWTFESPTGCHISDYATGSHGYPQIGWYVRGESGQRGRNRMVLTHRAAWVAVYGQIPDGMTIDHTCKNRRCVNVEHLRMLTNYENARRTSGRDWPLGQCVNGHPDSELHQQRGGKVICKPCLQASRDRWEAKNGGRARGKKP